MTTFLYTGTSTRTTVTGSFTWKDFVTFDFAARMTISPACLDHGDESEIRGIKVFFTDRKRRIHNVTRKVRKEVIEAAKDAVWRYV